MNFEILTLFPAMLEGFFSESILGRARESGAVRVACTDIRAYTRNKHRRVDDTPYGGGYGMLMTPQPIFDCHKAACETLSGRTRTIYFSPAGQKLNHAKALELKEYDNLILLCGHYEGIDERVTERIVDEEISIGDYVLTGGELPCAVLVDAVSRLIDGVLPDSSCYTEESIASELLEYPQYTKPAVFDGSEVPQVLRDGNHADIVRWRREMALEKTYRKRPELLDTAKLDRNDLIYLQELQIRDGK